MSNEAFDRAADLLELETNLTGPQARGTIRLALKDGGLDAKTVSPRELSIVFASLMPNRLENQGLNREQVTKICDRVCNELGTLVFTETRLAAAAMFERLDDARKR